MPILDKKSEHISLIENLLRKTEYLEKSARGEVEENGLLILPVREHELMLWEVIRESCIKNPVKVYDFFGCSPMMVDRLAQATTSELSQLSTSCYASFRPVMSSEEIIDALEKTPKFSYEILEQLKLVDPIAFAFTNVYWIAVRSLALQNRQLCMRIFGLSERLCDYLSICSMMQIQNFVIQTKQRFKLCCHEDVLIKHLDSVSQGSAQEKESSKIPNAMIALQQLCQPVLNPEPNENQTKINSNSQDFKIKIPRIKEALEQIEALSQEEKETTKFFQNIRGNLLGLLGFSASNIRTINCTSYSKAIRIAQVTQNLGFELRQSVHKKVLKEDGRLSCMKKIERTKLRLVESLFASNYYRVGKDQIFNNVMLIPMIEAWATVVSLLEKPEYKEFHPFIYDVNAFYKVAKELREGSKAYKTCPKCKTYFIYDSQETECCFCQFKILFEKKIK